MIQCTRRAAAFALAALCLLPLAAQAQAQYPTKPVRIILPLGAGGASDVITRLVAKSLSERNGQSFVVDNRPGANTIIGAEGCAKSPADGYTLCVVTASSMSINPFVYRKLPYDPAQDFQAVAPLVTPDLVLIASPTLPVKNMQELVAYAKANPGKLAYGSFGHGSDTHLFMEWLKRQTGTDLLHAPFNGFGPMQQAFFTGDIQLMYLSVGNPGLVGHVKSGKMRAMAVFGPARSNQLPDVPTFAEAGIGQGKGQIWFGLVAPTGVRADIVRKLNDQVGAAMQSAEVRQQLATMSMGTRAQTPEEFAEFLKQDREVWRSLVKSSGVTLD